MLNRKILPLRFPHTNRWQVGSCSKRTNQISASTILNSRSIIAASGLRAGFGFHKRITFSVDLDNNKSPIHRTQST